MLAATTFAAAIALITDAGPEAQSPPANHPECIESAVFSVRSYLSVQEHRLLKVLVFNILSDRNDQCLAWNDTSGAPVGRTLATTSLILLIICV